MTARRIRKLGMARAAWRAIMTVKHQPRVVRVGDLFMIGPRALVDLQRSHAMHARAGAAHDDALRGGPQTIYGLQVITDPSLDARTTREHRARAWAARWMSR